MSREFDFGTHVGVSFMGEASREFLVIGTPMHGDEQYRMLANLDQMGFTMNINELFYIRPVNIKNPTQALVLRERWVNWSKDTILAGDWLQV